MVIAALVSVVFIPAAIELIGQLLQMSVHMRAWPIAQLALMTVLAPLVTGMFIRQFLPAFALRVSRPVALFAAATLVASIAPVLTLRGQQ
jgi:predicted Na+-dependent transporter